MKFTIGDYARVKPGVLLEETGEEVPGWVGCITEVPRDPSDEVYLLELDTLSLDNLPEQFLQLCIEDSDPPIAYYFLANDLEPATQRDTKVMRSAAQNRIFDLVMGPDEEPELNNTLLNTWIAEFKKAPQAATFNETDLEEAEYIIGKFAEFAWNYFGEQVGDWTREGVEQVCLDLIPGKVTAEPEFFARVGPVLIQFFSFLGEQGYLHNGGDLSRQVTRIAPRIPAIAADPRKWGMAKSVGMQALQLGVDLSDENALEQFILAYNSNLPDMAGPKNRARPATLNPYKSISRNQVVRVKYADGSIREGKFKRLEADLLAGKCVLVE